MRYLVPAAGRLLQIRKELADHLEIALRDETLPGVTTLAGWALVRVEVALEGLRAGDLARAGDAEPLLGPAVGLLLHGVPLPIRRSSAVREVYGNARPLRGSGASGRTRRRGRRGRRWRRGRRPCRRGRRRTRRGSWR